MSEDLKVSVVEFSDRECYQLQWKDPITGRKKTKSSEVKKGGALARKNAAKAAGKLEESLRNGTYCPPSKVTWDSFRQRYEAEVLAGLAPRTGKKAASTFAAVEEIVNPHRLRDLTVNRISHLQKVLRDRGRSEATIKGHMAHLSAALNWAHEQGMLPVVPKLPRQKRAKRATSSTPMKGRPITTEEFERMLAKVADALTEKPTRRRKNPDPPAPEAVESWKHYLRGLWFSGLRLAESLELWWDRDDRLAVDLTGKHPMLRIPASLEKGNRDRVLPVSPEFAEFLLQTPEEQRTGPVFNPLPRRPERSERLGELAVGRIISAIGEAARVVVNSTSKLNPQTNERTEARKYASAHDLRRSFGERWSRRVMPQVLMELMRHESIDTTLRYYIGRNAQATADVLWEAHERANGNTSGNTGPNQASDSSSQESENPMHGKGF